VSECRPLDSIARQLARTFWTQPTAPYSATCQDCRLSSTMVTGVWHLALPSARLFWRLALACESTLEIVTPT
jgi:hypothetical protein